MACARALAELGAVVHLTSTTDRVHDRAAELRSAGTSVVADLTLEADVAALHAETGHVDVLVNNAGMLSVTAPDVVASVPDTSLMEWRADLARNLDTAFLVTRAYLPGMVAAGYGRIVNVASTTGMVGLTRAVAVEVAGRGVTCNAVAPGWIASESQSHEEAGHGRRSPAGRSGTPAEVAAAVAFLAAAESSYVTGHCLVVDGGNSVLESR